MFGYYFKLGVRSLRRNPALTALMVITLAVGVAASMSTLTILHMMSGDPIPQKSERLFVPVLDAGPKEGWSPGQDPDDIQMTYRDATNLYDAGKVGERRAIIFGVNMAVEPDRHDLGAFSEQGLAATHDMFQMFEVPFKYGQPWTAAEDKGAADVVVLSTGLADRLFGNVNPVGRRVRMKGVSWQVVGVADHWKPLPRYYHIISGNGQYGDEEGFFVPFSAAIRHETSNSGSMNCNERNALPGYNGVLQSNCTWIQFWIETASPGDRGDVASYLDNYVHEQNRMGRMPRKQPAKLYNVMEWLDLNKVVGNDNRLAVWLAFGFLALCLVNTIGLLLAKFSVRAPEVGIRRALGASRREIFSQFLVETAVVGLVGGAIGLTLAYGTLDLLSMGSESMKHLAHMDASMLVLTLLLSIAAAVLAGLLPTWRACQVTPAMQLKSQ